MDNYGNVTLEYPNREVRESMYHYILNDMGEKRSRGVSPIISFTKAFRNNDMERMEALIKRVFKELSYDVYKDQDVKQVEVFYHSIINILFRYLGYYVQTEMHTTRGRADTVVETDTHVYLFEFKLDKTAEAAFQQIKDRDYAAKYKIYSGEGTKKTIVSIGANFSTKTRYMDDFVLEIEAQS